MVYSRLKRLSSNIGVLTFIHVKKAKAKAMRYLLLLITTGGVFCSHAQHGATTSDMDKNWVVTKSLNADGSTGGPAGTAKHQYASALLNRYQSIHGSKGLSTNVHFNNGVGNRGFLGVLDRTWNYL